MKLPVEARLAWRYLFGKKSHSAINAIAGVSVVGMAVATAAIVCVLSVFNGFRDVLSDNSGPLMPDLLVEPVRGKVFSDGDSIVEALSQVEGVSRADAIVSEQALVIYRGQELPIKLRGVPSDLPTLRALQDKLVTEGSGKLRVRRENPEDGSQERGSADALLAVGVALRLDIYDPDSQLTLFAPKREGRLNTANPSASFVVDSLHNVGVFQVNQSEWDQNVVVTDIETAREILQYENEATSIELALMPGEDPVEISRKVMEILPPGLTTVKDRIAQQAINARMIEIEKWVTFLLLFFILIIASFNVVSTMSMLVIEKQDSLSLLHSIGLSSRRIGGVFAWESLYVTIIGAFSGILLGVVLVVSQMQFGWIKIQGDPSQLLTSSYPVRLEATDLLLTLIPLILIGSVCAVVAALFARSKNQK